MSTTEINRLEIIQQVMAHQLSHQKAAEQLEISCRHLKRLIVMYKRFGAAGLISKRRGKRSNHRYSEGFREKILLLLKTCYPDFGPTLAAEKLQERNGLSISKETLRQWMMSMGLWKSKGRSSYPVHQQRERRACYGELVQIDGSPHDWFEGRSPICCLLVFVDDATGRLMVLRFVEVECTQGYFDATREYIERYGRPLAFYSDRHTIFRVQIPEARSGTGESQFGRALRELGITLICANSPQAKGRVERANKTLQDRLVKELRLRGICSREEANAFLPRFMADYNQRFAVEPLNHTDVHRRELPDQSVLDLIFTKQCERQVSKNLELSYHNTIYQIQVDSPSYHLQHAHVKVCEAADGRVTLLYHDKVLDYKTFTPHHRPARIVSRKELDQHIWLAHKPWKPAKNHPWRTVGKGVGRQHTPQ